EGEQALVVLGAGGAALEVGAEPGQRCIGVLACDLQLDVAVELGEAGVASDFGPFRAEQASDDVVQIRVLHQLASSGERPGARPASSRCARSLRRASCSVLYRAPRAVPSRSARSSIGTPSTASETSAP